MSLIRSSYLGVIMLGMSKIQQEVSKMVHLKKGIRISIGITDQIDDADEGTIGEDFTQNGNHLHLFQTMITRFAHFRLRQTSGRGSVITLDADMWIKMAEERTDLIRLPRFLLMKMFIEMFVFVVVQSMANEREEDCQR